MMCGTPEPPLSRRGFHCECHLNELRLALFDAYSPHEALRWIRVSLTVIATTLDEEPYRQARTWLDHDQDQAARTLTEGRPIILTLNQRTTTVTWTARPVIYLSLHQHTPPPAHGPRA